MTRLEELIASGKDIETRLDELVEALAAQKSIAPPNSEEWASLDYLEQHYRSLAVSSKTD